ncbi:unnamed protein product, partial [Amoebophrya sp. A120]
SACAYSTEAPGPGLDAAAGRVWCASQRSSGRTPAEVQPLRRDRVANFQPRLSRPRPPSPITQLAQRL